MTREKKKNKRKQIRFLRRQKKVKELHEIKNVMDQEGMTFQQARSYVRHGLFPFQCEIGCTYCELRGFCNGDC